MQVTKKQKYIQLWSNNQRNNLKHADISFVIISQNSKMTENIQIWIEEGTFIAGQ